MEFSVIGFNISKEVPSTPEEYNALAPKRVNACVEDAVSNTIYRGTSPVIRDKFCDYLEAERKIVRKNFGTEDEPQPEKEGVYIKRAIAELVAANGKTEEGIRADLLPFIQKFADEAPFDPSLREGSGQGPAIAKRDLALAEQVTKDGKENDVAAKLATLLGRAVANDVKSLARAIADNRRALEAKAALEQKTALGL